MALIAPSILAANFEGLSSEVEDTIKCGADILHMDIMDGHFVPNISYGPKFVETIHRLADTPLDVHLMLTNPEDHFDAFIRAGATTIIFHIEVHPDPAVHLKALKDRGIKAGLSLNPDHDLSTVSPFLQYCDRLLVMSVFPGFSGQEFIPETLKTVEKARAQIDRQGLGTLIAIDGGVGKDNARRVVNAGADILIMGSAFYSSDNRKSLVDLVHSLPNHRN